MNYKSRFLRLALAVGVAGMISAQIPMSGGIAMADDDYNLGGGSSSRGLIEAAVIALFGYGIFSTFTSGNNTPADTGGAAPVDTGGGGAGPGALPPSGVTAPIWDVANGNPDLNQFATEAQDAGLQGQLRDNGQYTVFAPTNAAFALLPPATLTQLNQSGNQAALKAIIALHIVPGHAYTIAQLKTLPGVTTDPGAALTSLQGALIYIKFTPGAAPTDPGALAFSAVPFGPGAEDGAPITQTDIPASNGIIHPVGQMLNPALPAAPTPPAGP